jgi:hypothetical protein
MSFWYLPRMWKLPLRGADERRAETPFASPAVLHAAPRGDLLSADCMFM